MQRPLALLLTIALALVVAPGTGGGGQARAGDAVRLSGETRYETAIAVSKLWESSREVVLVTGEDFPDALSAGPFASSRGAPILLTDASALPSAVRAELVRLRPERVWIVGGDQAVSVAVSDAVADATGAEVRRLAGRDRFATAQVVADALGSQAGLEALIALGSHPEAGRAWPDAVSAGAFNATGAPMPLLLVSPAGVPDGTVPVLDHLGIERALLIGGSAAIPGSVEDELAASVSSTERLAGPGRYATSRAVVDEVLGRLPARPVPLIVASGENYPDALVAGALAARLGAPLVLVPSPLDEATLAWFRARQGDFSDVYVIGGDAAVPPEVADEVCRELCGPEPDPSPTPTDSPSPAPTPSPSADPEPTPTGSPTPDPQPSPDPGDLPVLEAGAVPPGPSSSMHAATAFLYSGPDAVQTGMDPDTIEPLRVAVLRGRVLDTAGEPLPGVEVTVHDRPEFGRTLTRADGAYDLAVNGGGPLVLDLHRDGVLPVQRKVSAPWRDYVALDDVVMTPLDPAVTVVQMGAVEPQVARGSVIEDVDGPRQATLVFEPGTSAEMVLPDGTRQPLEELSVRATEYTVGDAGPAAMPGELPPSSGYTYAVELSVDEAMAAGATSVEFDRAVPVYVDNFLGFATGERVPLGWYDREEARWVPADDGLVIEIVRETDGLAEVDTTGDGVADGTGLSEVELAELAELYEPGQSLWRVALDHFTPWDCNWPYGPPQDAEPPSPPDPPELPEPGDGTDGDCEQAGSIIHCQSQSLTERIPLAGTAGGTSYASARVAGYGGHRTIEVPLIGPSVPSGLESVEVTTSVAGQRRVDRYVPEPGLVHRFDWDGRDAYGRTLSGAQAVVVRLDYVYPAVYYASPVDFERSFARFGTGPIGVGSGGGGGGGGGGGSAVAPMRAQQKIRVTRYVTSRTVGGVTFGGADADQSDLGGWSLDVHHAYDPVAGALYRGDGTIRVAERVLGQLVGIIGGGLEVDVPSLNPGAIAVDGTGAVHYFDETQSRVFRVGQDGAVTQTAGRLGSCSSCPWVDATPRPATGVRLTSSGGSDLAIGPDGAMYLAHATYDAEFVRRDVVSRIQDGVIQVIAGLGDVPAEGVDPNQIGLGFVRGIAVGADGTLWIASSSFDRVFRVGTDGLIHVAVGPPVDDTPEDDGGFAGDGGPASTGRLEDPQDIEIDGEGTLSIADAGNGRVRVVSPTGVIDTIAGGGSSGELGDGGPATEATLVPSRLAVQQGTLLLTTFFGDATYVQAVDPTGTITTVAGGYSRFDPVTDSGLATETHLEEADVAVRPDGGVIVSRRSGPIYALRSALPGVSVGETVVAAQDGAEAYVFDGTGRHLHTLDGMTGDVVRSFAYDVAGRLTSVSDREGDRTVLERDASGQVVAIVAPGGHRTPLTFDAEGLLASVTDPTGVTWTMTYGDGARLSSFSRSGAGTSTFGYDASGLLVVDTHPVEGQTTLSRTEEDDGRRVTVEVTSPAGLVTRYETVRSLVGGLTRRVTDPHGQVSEQRWTPDGRVTLTHPDGTIEESALAADPRFGFQAPVVAHHVVTTPAGRSTATTRTVSVEGVTASGDAERVTRTVTHQGRTWTSVWDATARSLTETSPAGRTDTRRFDALGRLSVVEPGDGLAAVTIAYDEHGRVTAVDHGGGATSYVHDTAGRVASQTDATGSTTSYVYDAADRLLEAIAPDGATYRFGYDGAGRPVTVTAPDGTQHVVDRRADGRVVGWTYPDLGESMFHLDADGRLVDATLPSTATVSHVRDAAQRLERIDGPEADVAFGYDSVLARPASVSREPLGGVAQQLSVERDGPLLTARTLSGEVDATFSHTFDDRMLVDSVQLVSGTDTVTIAHAYDDDGLLIGRGPLAFDRRGPAGAVLQVRDAANDTYTFRTYDARGAVDAVGRSVAGAQVHQVTYERDAVGRIVRRSETAGGATTVTTYGYDARGQLLEVVRDGTVVESYTYDGNGNRTSRQLGGGPVESATFDGELLLAHGAVAYAFDDDGFLTSRGADTFDYHRDGALRSATVEGTTVTYTTDGLGRRVARTVDGATTEYLYGEPTDPLLVTAIRRDDGGLTVLHYDEAGFLAAFEQDGERFAVATDEVGSPRVVIDSTGAIREVWEYDAFGGVTPGQDDPTIDLPLGFAGGLPDATTGLVRFGARDYDPVAGRWTARDPLHFQGGQLNLYAYAGNDPVNRRDPAGLSATGQGWQEQLKEVWDSGVEWAEQNGRKIAEQVAGLSERGQKWVDRINLGEKAFNSYTRLRDALCAAGGNKGEEGAALLNEALEWLKDTPASWVTPVEAGQAAFNRALDDVRPLEGDVLSGGGGRHTGSWSEVEW